MIACPHGAVGGADGFRWPRAPFRPVPPPWTNSALSDGNKEGDQTRQEAAHRWLTRVRRVGFLEFLAAGQAGSRKNYSRPSMTPGAVDGQEGPTSVELFSPVLGAFPLCCPRPSLRASFLCPPNKYLLKFAPRHTFPLSSCPGQDRPVSSLPLCLGDLASSSSHKA